MARIRTIKPEFFRSRSLAKCPLEARVTFAGMWTEADDAGHGVADPRILKGAIWPLDDDCTHLHVSAHIRILVETGHIRLYEVDGETYFEIVNWETHQAAAYRRGEPKYPAPDGYLDVTSHGRMQEDASRTPKSAGTRNEEGNEEGNEENLAPASPARKPRPPDPIFDALIEACGLDPGQLTKSARGRVNTAAKELRDIGASPEGIHARAQVHRRRWPDAELTPTSLSANYAQLSKAAGSSGAGIRVCPDCQQALDRHDPDMCQLARKAS